MKTLKIRGGARIGLINITWPFAQLMISDEIIELKILFKRYSFSKQNIFFIEPYRGLSSSGVIFKHEIPKYPKVLAFWSFRDPNQIIGEIEKFGFPA